MKVRMVEGLILVLATLVPMTSNASAQGQSHSFSRDVGALMALQDAAARGDSLSVRQQRIALRHIGDIYLRGGSVISPSPGNSSAMLGYILSGGYPELVKLYLGNADLPPFSAAVLKGATLFMEGKTEEASEVLHAIEPRDLPPADGGRMSLVKGMLLADTDSKKLELFEFTINAMPGTLVEESATRRIALAAATSRQWRSSLHYANRYLRRFPDSVYAAEFLNAYVTLFVRQHDPDNANDLSKVEILLNRVNETKRRRLYFLMATTALRSGKTSIVQFAARRAGRLSLSGGQESVRAELYNSIFDITSRDGTVAAELLRNMDPSLLTGEDRQLLEAALLVDAQIRQLDTDRPRLPGTPDSPEVASSVSRKAELAISAADETLSSGNSP